MVRAVKQKEPTPAVTRIGPGTYRIEVDGLAHIVYVAGPAGDRWVHCDGHVYHRPFADETRARRRHGGEGHQSLSSPMPATVRKVLVETGTHVRKGDTLIVLEAMKMELPIRAGMDAVVSAVSCREGELVQPGAVLVELE
jgi:3-methylcrotonyl-CoA carboxylase alpha subunit